MGEGVALDRCIRRDVCALRAGFGFRPQKGAKGYDLSGEAISEDGKMALKNFNHRKHRIHKNLEGV
mgnify:CR=1 FL=1